MRINLDVLQILDALEKHGSFAAAAESFFKTPAALSYMVQKLESDLNIQLLDRSGHRAKFTETGKMVLEKGRALLNAARDLEKHAEQMESGWEKELLIALDGSFPFHLLLPMIEQFYRLNTMTRLRFSHQTLAGSWEELTHNGADIILGAINEPPGYSGYSFKMLGMLDNVFVVSPAHPLAKEKDPLDNKQLRSHRAIVIGDTARHSAPFSYNCLDDQERMVVYDFHSKLMALISGLGCGYMPRHTVETYLRNGSLVEKKTVSFKQKDIAFLGWNNLSDGLAARWWRDQILACEMVKSLYDKT
ncbi:LysR family transcriptional regulator [Enterobacillus tribolii]|uniref:DNA-binding transcriptional LysR family regulator n=1 Tax=Enterobacillus tribolii TaxID=1487935 RepID=A0A370QHF3_9GAMM|nr:LysR family transcriptional regulator [Enterobacillus tribolii]MBW7982507.1 LysR family transcriptional regulator [Enterobacillus tribolii]RDK87785.1 DNA-binding transcriptional LysR family regulator [Enterobacillus tribolii]